MDIDTHHELERLRRSIALLAPGARALDREQALRVLADLQAAQREAAALRARLEQMEPFEVRARPSRPRKDG
jgi:hypothetical protein